MYHNKFLFNRNTDIKQEQTKLKNVYLLCIYTYKPADPRVGYQSANQGLRGLLYNMAAVLKKTHIIKQSNYDAKFLPNYMPKNRQTKQRRPIFCVCASRSWSGRSIWQVGPWRSLLSVTVRTAGSILFVTIAYYSSYLVHNQSAWQVQRCPYYLSLIRLKYNS